MWIRHRVFPLLLCLLFLAPVLAPASAAQSPPAATAQSSAAKTPADSAKAQATDAQATDTEAAAPAAAETPAGVVAAVESKALVADGLLAQVFSRFDVWFDGLTEQLSEAASAIGDLRALDQWWDTAFSTEEARHEALRGMMILGAILAVALLAELIVHRLLRHPRKLVAQQAAVQYARTEQREAVRTAELAAALAKTTTTNALEPDLATSPADAPIEVARQEAGMQADLPAAPPAAERIGAVLKKRRKAIHHWGLLGRMPYAFADALLGLLPLAAFLGVVGLLMTTQRGATSQFYVVSLPIINAYVGVRVALALVRLMASPAGQGLRLIHMPDHSARYMYRWACAIFVVAALGMALGDVTVHMGAGTNVRTLLAKLSSLIVHLMLIVIVFQTRGTVSARIRGQVAEGGAPSSLRDLLARIWPVAATLFIATFWIVWALSVANGFQRALTFLAITAAVLAVSRILWIVVVGALDRSFEQANPRIEAMLNSGAERYQALLRQLVNILFVIGTAIALLEAWGVDALGWFDDGTVGRRLASAATTIIVAGILAIVAWEAISLALRRRIQAWTDSGDLLRAARLRTLVPMIRTVVLIVIGLIVLMTALNELGINVAPLLAGASIIGVALGFGSQKLVQDFITGIFLLMENAMQVGDSVTVAGVSGTVEYLSIRTVKLRAGDGSLHVVPFSSVTTVNNSNRGLGNAAVRVSVTADSDIDKVYAELRRIAAGMRSEPDFAPLILDDLSIYGVDQIDGSMATIAGQIRTTDKGRWAVQREFNRRVLQGFREQGIALANPKETLVMQLAAPSGAQEPAS